MRILATAITPAVLILIVIRGRRGERVTLDIIVLFPFEGIKEYMVN
jgi:hypothetical protein